MPSSTHGQGLLRRLEQRIRERVNPTPPTPPPSAAANRRGAPNPAPAANPRSGPLPGNSTSRLLDRLRGLQQQVDSMRGPGDPAAPAGRAPAKPAGINPESQIPGAQRPAGQSPTRQSPGTQPATPYVPWQSKGGLGVYVDTDPRPPYALTVISVIPKSAAESIGMRVGDQIESVNQKPVLTGQDLQTALAAVPSGSETLIKVKRSGRTMYFAPRLRPANPDGMASPQTQTQTQTPAGNPTSPAPPRYDAAYGSSILDGMLDRIRSIRDTPHGAEPDSRRPRRRRESGSAGRSRRITGPARTDARCS
ncbi:MAG: PDZ domain-containing protein [Planctomycetota bacterium]